MTEGQLKSKLGTLVLYRNGKGEFKKAKLMYVFPIPEGTDKDKLCVFLKTLSAPDGFLIYAKHIYYAFPHFNDEIKQFHSHLKEIKPKFVIHA